MGDGHSDVVNNVFRDELVILVSLEFRPTTQLTVCYLEHSLKFWMSIIWKTFKIN